MISAIKRRVKHQVKYLADPEYKYKYLETNRLRKFPRYTETTTKLLGEEIRVPDSASFFSAYREIFEHHIYKFTTEKEEPYILDCGANIGLSIIYFKMLYPKARIIGFEPDPKIFESLEYNVKQYTSGSSVSLIRKALWNEETTLKFTHEGADAGNLFDNSTQKKTYDVSTARLKEFMKEEVDMLKIDIEGAEVCVLKDSIEYLENVKRLFVEYHSFCDRPQELDVLLNMLKNAGFRVVLKSPGGGSTSPFEKVDTYNNMDLFVNIFAYKN